MIVAALSYFDSLISGSTDGKHVSMEITDKHATLLLSLFNHALDHKDDKNIIDFDEYIQSTFKCFVESKTDIIITYKNLSFPSVNDKIRRLIIPELMKMDDDDLMKDQDNLKNLPKPEILEVFNKVKSMTLITRNVLSDYDYKFSFYALLSLIKMTSLRKISVLSRGFNKRYKIHSWMISLWALSNKELVNIYNKSQYQIELKYAIGFKGLYHGIVITKL